MTNPLTKQLSRILGYNARALHYTNPDLGSSSAKKTAHNKLATKKILQKSGLPTPRLHGLITNRQELKKFRWTKLPPSFVIKPNNAFGGGGILVVFGRNKKGNWVLGDRSEIFIRQLKNHVLNILDGNFSPYNVPDITLIEQRVKNHPDLKQHSFQGIPDIRVIIYNLVPIMAMLRLPTQESHGKANLHAGGIGVGVDLSRGTTTNATYRGHVIESLPHKRLSLSGIRIPHWNKILILASQASQAIGLTFAGVDITIDRDDGPLVLEINCNPGLDIQLANLSPLRSRLRRVEDLNISNPQRGVRISRGLFGQDVEQEIEEISGKTIINTVEPISIVDLEGNRHNTIAKIDTGAWRTTIDKSLAKKLGLHSNILERKHVRSALGKQHRPIVELSFSLRDHSVKTSAFLADRSKMKYEIIVGRRDLVEFLIEPQRKQPGIAKKS